jgi:hypothetical protein
LRAAPAAARNSSPPPPQIKQSPVQATLTHARQPVAQGALKAARDILQELLVTDPDNAEARGMLENLTNRVETPRVGPKEESVPDRMPGDPQSLAAAFGALRKGSGPSRKARLQRLRRWAERLEASSPESSDTPPDPDPDA